MPSGAAPNATSGRSGFLRAVTQLPSDGSFDEIALEVSAGVTVAGMLVRERLAPDHGGDRDAGDQCVLLSFPAQPLTIRYSAWSRPSRPTSAILSLAGGRRGDAGATARVARRYMWGRPRSLPHFATLR
jgi:hypothetical protein